MSIAEKLTTVAENQQKVYEAGFAAGQAQGSSSDDYWQYVNSLEYAFAYPSWDGEKVFEINVPNLSRAITYVIQDVNGIKKLKLKGNTANNAITTAYPFYSRTIEEIDLTEFGAGGLKFKTFKGLAYGCSKLKYIYGELDCSEITGSIEVPFTYASSLIEVRFKVGTVAKSLDITPSPNLSDASVQSIIDSLADLTEQTAQTIGFHSTVLARLTDEQIDVITAKNWTF